MTHRSASRLPIVSVTRKLNRLGRWLHNELRVVQLIHYVQFVAKLKSD